MLAKVVADDHYHDLAKLSFVFADLLAEQLKGIDAAVIQIDEPHLPGHPDQGEIAAAAINRVLAACENQSESAVHLCFGNFGGQTIQDGGYRMLIDFVNQMQCDHLILETTRRTETEVKALSNIDSRIGLGVGVIDVKDLLVETPEVVAKRIETLADLLSLERLQYVHPDCGLQVLPRPVADGKLRALVAGRDLFLGQHATELS